MWPLKRKIKQRRLEVRRAIQSAGGPGWFAQFRAPVGVMPLLFLAAFYVAVLMLDAWPVEPLTYRVGQFVERDIHARVPFIVRSADLHEKAKDQARLSAPAVYALDEAYLNELIGALRAAPGYLATTQPGQESSPPPVPIPAEHSPSWEPYLLPEGRAVYDAQIDQLAQRLARLTVVSATQRTEDLTRQTVDVWVVLPTGRTKLDAGRDLIATDRPAELSAAADDAVVPLDSTIAPDVKAFLVESLAARPIYVRDELASELERQRAVDAVVPPTRLYQTGQRLVRRSLGREDDEPRGLTVEEYGLLQHEHARYLEGQRQWTLWARFVGRAVMLAMLTGALAMYIYRFRRRIVTNRLRAVALACLLLISLLLSKTMVLLLAWNPHVAVLPVLFATIILVIAYDQRFALMVGLLLSLFVASQLRADLSLLLVLAAATSCSAFALRDIRSRSRLIEVTALVAAIVFVVALGLSVADGMPLGFSAKDAAWAGGMALLVGFIVQGILPLIERGFNIATSMTLLEWCDASKPLLKRLAMEAPGTYNHSLQLGTMCEAAAEAIGANGLLARVGAYYHDIGKINKPRYFMENRDGNKNLHEGLSPEMSMRIIEAHVKDGVEMAREYGLPGALHEFIATHHGTTVVQYFYHAATEQRKGDADGPPAESEFRYPGPKPRSSEAGILMLADASESSVRAMVDPNPSRIETQVSTMVNRRLMDGQLDECGLTLKDVHAIEQSLIKSLCAIYHARIAYPKPADEREPAPADQPS